MMQARRCSTTDAACKIPCCQTIHSTGIDMITCVQPMPAISKKLLLQELAKGRHKESTAAKTDSHAASSECI